MVVMDFNLGWRSRCRCRMVRFLELGWEMQMSHSGFMRLIMVWWFSVVIIVMMTVMVVGRWSWWRSIWRLDRSQRSSIRWGDRRMVSTRCHWMMVWSWSGMWMVYRSCRTGRSTCTSKRKERWSRWGSGCKYAYCRCMPNKWLSLW